MSLRKSKRGDDELPHNKLLKTEEVTSLEHSKLDLITKKDEEILREYHRQLAANVPMVKTLFKAERVILDTDIHNSLSLWPFGIRIEDPENLDFGRDGEYCDDCSMFPYAKSGTATLPLMFMVLGGHYCCPRAVALTPPPHWAVCPLGGNCKFVPPPRRQSWPPR